ncbi:unnamed protein product [Dimorphilus gyrociliatus]|uniref:Ion transport domain-containing protein n=1 Tax=Dimorphilus gyrociliatus TaxID=2664684 RepID=A0A7I8W4Q0_9ANNE|nr:unnamed protein product [Dimorphilus gyrociliatus]
MTETPIRQAVTWFSTILDNPKKYSNEFSFGTRAFFTCLAKNCLLPSDLEFFLSKLSVSQRNYLLNPNDLDILENSENLINLKDVEVVVHWMKDIEYGPKFNTGKLEYEHALAYACWSGDDNCTKIVLKYCDIFAKDKHGRNIIHCLAHMSGLLPHTTIKQYDIIMNYVEENSLCVMESQRLLLEIEDEELRTPLDIAVRMGHPTIFNSIFNTSPLNRRVISQNGLRSIIYYNVTRYEKDNSNYITFDSLLYWLSRTTFSDATRYFKYGNIFEKEPIKTYIEKKFHFYKYPLILWGCESLIVIIIQLLKCIFFLTSGNVNITPIALDIITVVVTSHLISSDFLLLAIRFSNYKERKKKHKNNNHALADAITLRVVIILLSLLVIILSILRLFQVDLCKYRNIFYIIHVAALSCVVLSVLIFTQLLGDFAHVLLIVERVTGNIFVYLVLCFICISIFALGFSVTHTDCKLNNQTMSNQSDVPNYAISLYYTLLYTMKITTPDDIFFTSSQSSTASIIIFIVGIIFVHLIITNLLIAVMNRHVNDWYDHIDLALILIRLSLICSIEKFRFIIAKTGLGKRIVKFMFATFSQKCLKKIGNELFLEVIKDISDE